ncbi:MAG: hypothetical protein M1830_004949 [Pleopsidium flavum]|nr:MAG: hypothetical protein M1830_004949 [Pleopsidium flavum]
MSTPMTFSLEARPTADKIDAAIEVPGAERPTGQRKARVDRSMSEDSSMRHPSERLLSQEQIWTLTENVHRQYKELGLDVPKPASSQHHGESPIPPEDRSDKELSDKEFKKLLKIIRTICTEPNEIFRVKLQLGSKCDSEASILPKHVSNCLISEKILEIVYQTIRRKFKEKYDMFREEILKKAKESPSDSLSIQPSTQIPKASGHSSLSSRTVVSYHDESSAIINATIQELLHSPISEVSREFTGPDGMPLGIEVAVNAYKRGECSTGEIEYDMLPQGLKIPEPKTKKRASSDEASLARRATRYTAVSRTDDDKAKEPFPEKAGGETLQPVAESDDIGTVRPSLVDLAMEASDAGLKSEENIQSVASSIHSDFVPSSCPESLSDKLSVPVAKRDVPILFPVVHMPTKPEPLRLMSVASSDPRESLSIPLPTEFSATELSDAYSMAPLSAPLPYRHNTIGLFHPDSEASLDTAGPNSPFILRNETLERRSSPESLMEYAKASEDVNGVKRIEPDDGADGENTGSGIWQDDVKEKRINHSLNISEGYPMKNKSSRLKRMSRAEEDAEGQPRAGTTRRSSSLYSRELDNAVSTENQAIVLDMMHDLDTGARRKGRENFGKMLSARKKRMVDFLLD